MLVKFWADFVQVADAVLFSVAPLAAVTRPRMVTDPRAATWDGPVR